MKHIDLKVILTFIILNVLINTQNTSFGQVTYEHTYLLTPNQEWFLTNLGDNEYKYVMYSYDSSKFSLYNLDHTPFLSDVQIPFQVVDSAAHVWYRLGYITRTLFDCDSTNIEYAIMLDLPNKTHHPNFAVYRTDGTLIFSKDTVGTIFSVGMGSGSYELHPIMMTPEGAKLYLFNYDSIGFYERNFVYSLCGTLPEMLTEVNQSGSFVKVYPNPSSGRVEFEILSPSHEQECELMIFDSNFRTVKREVITGTNNQINLDNKSISSGTYFYSLQNRNKVFQNGKFVISK
jgi:hypothetical protein